MNTKTMVAGLAIGFLLISAGIHSTQSVRAETGAAATSQAMTADWDEDCHATMMMMMMMRLMHQHHGMMDQGMMRDWPDGMMDDGPGMMDDGMMDDGMMGDGPGMMDASPVPEATTAPPSSDPGAEALAPDASPEAGHEQHHASPSPSASPGPS